VLLLHEFRPQIEINSLQTGIFTNEAGPAVMLSIVSR
jgi:hypothetical protein